MGKHQAITVLCVEANRSAVEAIKQTIASAEDMEWAGSIAELQDLDVELSHRCPNVVLMDIDMPGRNPFAMLEVLRQNCPKVRVIVFSRRIHSEVIDRAFVSGAWGFLSKRETARDILSAIRHVWRGEYVMGNEVQAEFTMPRKRTG